MTDETPGADGVGDDFDVEVCHFADGCAESQVDLMVVEDMSIGWM